MDSTAYFLIGAVSLLLWIAILYSVISNATDSKKKNKLLEVQVRILVKIALKNGVDRDELGEIVKDLKEQD